MLTSKIIRSKTEDEKNITEVNRNKYKYFSDKTFNIAY